MGKVMPRKGSNMFTIEKNEVLQIAWRLRNCQPQMTGIDILFFHWTWHMCDFKFTSLSFAGQRMENVWSDCLATKNNWRVGPMEDPTSDQWDRLCVRDMTDDLVKDYCEWKWENFWKHPLSNKNAEDVKDFDWLSKDAEGFDSQGGFDFSDDVSPLETRKFRRKDKADANIRWPQNMASIVPPHPIPQPWGPSASSSWPSGGAASNWETTWSSGGAASSWETTWSGAP